MNVSTNNNDKMTVVKSLDYSLQINLQYTINGQSFEENIFAKEMTYQNGIFTFYANKQDYILTLTELDNFDITDPTHGWISTYFYNLNGTLNTIDVRTNKLSYDKINQGILTYRPYFREFLLNQLKFVDIKIYETK
jgi:hypothetical protein